METNIYVYTELTKVAQSIINEAVNNDTLADVLPQGKYFDN